ncbi:MAG: segregation/condensation protein A [Planctomycetes bacterium]|nr:segregation/condensation protein A [Planctomycetota bacterium]
MSLPQEQFRIAIDAFDGPLDLLLYLVRRAEVDIHSIPIAQITDDYLDVLRQGASVDVEMAGEFLVMAATLIEIKSRSLVPPEQVLEDDETLGEGEGEDPRGDLIRQLLSYQRIRTASELLEKRRNIFALRFEAHVGIVKEQIDDVEPSLELDDVHILDLSDAYEHIASSIDFTQLDGHHVAFDDVPIELCQEDLLERLKSARGHQVSLQETFSGLAIAERVGMFLATLELVRLRRVTVLQDDDACGVIRITLCAETTSDEQNVPEH